MAGANQCQSGPATAGFCARSEATIFAQTLQVLPDKRLEHVKMTIDQLGRAERDRLVAIARPIGDQAVGGGLTDRDAGAHGRCLHPPEGVDVVGVGG